MRKILRKWLGIDELEAKLLGTLVELGQINPTEAEKIVKDSVKDWKLINNHGEEGQL